MWNFREKREEDSASCSPMEATEPGYTRTSRLGAEDGAGEARVSPPPRVPAPDHDDELVRKKRLLEMIERQIASKRRDLAMKRQLRHEEPAGGQVKRSFLDQDAPRPNCSESDDIWVPPIPEPERGSSFVFWKDEDSCVNGGTSGPLDISTNLFPKPRTKGILKHHYSVGHRLEAVERKSPSPLQDPDELETVHTQGTLHHNHTSKNFQRFLSVLNKGVDIDRLSAIVNATGSAGSEKMPPGRSSAPENTFCHQDQRRTSSPSPTAVKDYYNNEPMKDRSVYRGSAEERKTLPSPEKEESRRSKAKDKHSRRKRSRSRSVSSEDERVSRTERDKKEQLQRIQTLLQTVGLELGEDEVSRLTERTKERLYGKKPQRKSKDLDEEYGLNPKSDHVPSSVTQLSRYGSVQQNNGSCGAETAGVLTPSHLSAVNHHSTPTTANFPHILQTPSLPGPSSTTPSHLSAVNNHATFVTANFPQILPTSSSPGPAGVSHAYYNSQYHVANSWSYMQWSGTQSYAARHPYLPQATQYYSQASPSITPDTPNYCSAGSFFLQSAAVGKEMAETTRYRCLKTIETKPLPCAAKNAEVAWQSKKKKKKGAGQKFTIGATPPAASVSTSETVQSLNTSANSPSNNISDPPPFPGALKDLAKLFPKWTWLDWEEIQKKFQVGTSTITTPGLVQ
ncbi:uncharacterized protein LOC114786831 isoform X2 [Denticeps clupeoides]|nr:uncharacterized protein LOC114786831 isoform X2 [Denticeps clupeoides]